MRLWIQHMLIRESRDQHAFDHYPGLIAVFHALHRLLAPRHPPHALSSLAAFIFCSALVVWCLVVWCLVFPPADQTTCHQPPWRSQDNATATGNDPMLFPKGSLLRLSSSSMKRSIRFVADTSACILSNASMLFID